MHSPVKRPPDFIGLGAQKAGTSWLHIQLGRHPGIWQPPVKELHYFDRDLPGATFADASLSNRLKGAPWREAMAEHLSRLARAHDRDELAWWTRYYLTDHDDAWYRSLFALAPPECLVGEITPRYAICGEAQILRMHTMAPEAKLLFLLRDPVQRFWSQYRMFMGRNSISLGNPTAILDFFESPNGRPRGLYTQTLLKYCRRFSPSQILIVFYDAIANSPDRLLAEVFDFLGLPHHAIPPESLAEKVYVSSRTDAMSESIRQHVAASYRQEMESLAQVFGGYAEDWLTERESKIAGPIRYPTIRLTSSHVTQFAGLSVTDASRKAA